MAVATFQARAQPWEGDVMRRTIPSILAAVLFATCVGACGKRPVPPPPSQAPPPPPAPINVAPPPPPAVRANAPVTAANKVHVTVFAPGYAEAMTLVDWMQANVATGEMDVGAYSNGKQTLTAPFSGTATELSTRLDKKPLGKLGVLVRSVVPPDALVLDLVVLDQHLQHAR